ncbi:MAG: hypothetical protein ACI8UO_002838 [Verrucomicrobiales bacterium]|jgi:hypothetical protein
MKQILAFLFLTLAMPIASWASEFQAGAAVVDASPLDLDKFPVLVNGGMNSRTANEVQDPINVRAVVCSDGKTEIALVVVDSCMMPRPMLDKAKKLASEKTGIPAENMMMSATHTHTAPSTLACLGTKADIRYQGFLIDKLVEAVAAAQAKLQPAKVGWDVQKAAEFTALRRWVRRPDRVTEDPFGNFTVRATMHAGSNWDNVTGESGPEDPDLSLISFQSVDGKPIAVFANFSMHYFSGVKALSADYFGRFANELKATLAPDDPDFVGIMSHGCSGDVWRRDYTERDYSVKIDDAPADLTVDEYAQQLAARALTEYKKIEHESSPGLAMSETRMTLDYRVPDKQLLEWSKEIADEVGEDGRMDRTQVYAMEQTILHERQETEIVVQAIRIGDIAIATTPNETYALTALKLKAMSPLEKLMVIELANGGDGYIPPPEQHVVGGYNTWAARSAGLEVQAEPKITEALLQALEVVADYPRRLHAPSQGPAAREILAAKPASYWRMDELALPRASDLSGNNRDGVYEDGVLFHLEGARSDAFNLDGELNRAAHFCGGRMAARVAGLGEDYSVSLWFWNGMPDGARDVAGWMFSRGRDHGLDPNSEHLGLRGDGTLVFQHGGDGEAGSAAAGSTKLERWTWNHAMLVREAGHVRVYLNGAAEPEIDVESVSNFPESFDTVFVGGRCDRSDSWEGRIDEAAIFDRALSADERKKLSVQ